MRSPRPDDWPIFGHDAPDVAWRPDPGAAVEARLARFLRSTGEPLLDALQARATADPGWFWGAAADDIAVAWALAPVYERGGRVVDFLGNDWNEKWGGKRKAKEHS